MWTARRAAKPAPTPDPASPKRPVGDMASFLEDISARGFRPDGILDVGAHKGDWTRLAAAVFPEARILFMEPQRELEQQLRGVEKELPGTEWIPAGAGATSGEACFTIWEDFAGSSFLPKADPTRVAAGEQRMTPILTLDSVVADHPGFRPDLVKIDVQGFEMEVLRGAESLFEMTGVFVIECSLFTASRKRPLARDIIDHLSNHGYELYDIPGFLRRPADGALGQLDLAFAKADGPLRQHTGWN